MAIIFLRKLIFIQPIGRKRNNHDKQVIHKRNLFCLAQPQVKILKLPKIINMYCPSCKKHTPHEVERVRKRKASEFRAGQRRFRRVTSGYGGFPRPKYEGREKPTKRVSLKYKCQTCKKAVTPPSIRAKKFELVEVQ